MTNIENIKFINFDIEYIKNSNKIQHIPTVCRNKIEPFCISWQTGKQIFKKNLTNACIFVILQKLLILQPFGPLAQLVRATGS